MLLLAEDNVVNEGSRGPSFRDPWLFELEAGALTLGTRFRASIIIIRTSLGNNIWYVFRLLF